MHLFTRLVAVAIVTLAGVLVWDLSQERLVYPGKKLIVYASMFGPGEPMQQIYAGPPPATAARRPFGPEHGDHLRALAQAWPQYRDQLFEAFERIHEQPIEDTPADPGLSDLYSRLDAGYVSRLVEAVGQSDRGNRLKLFYAFADAHPQFDAKLILTFERLHPAWTVGLFEDFERRHPDHKIVPRWDSRWVLSANRPRFLTGTDVPDIITGALAELRILYRENLALPLDRPLPDASKPAWRKDGILKGETAYADSSRPFASDFYEWSLERSKYEISQEDIDVSGNPFPAGSKVLYMLPRQVHCSIIFYNKAHFRLIGRDGNDVPRTVAEFEEICRKLRKAGKEPIANDGMVYISMWWEWLVRREIGEQAYEDTVMNRPGAGRFAGPDADPRYLEIARRLRRWRDDEKFWMEGFSSSQWPAAQRRFGRGDCTFLFTGSWLPTEIASTRSHDPNVMELGCFVFPGVEGGTGSQQAMDAGPQGWVICRQGANPEGAVLLLRYLQAHGGALLAEKLAYISTNPAAPFPPALADIEPVMKAAKLEDFYEQGPAWYAPKFNKFVLGETFAKFFVIRSDNLTPEQFLQELERRAQEHYRQYGGTAQ